MEIPKLVRKFLWGIIILSILGMPVTVYLTYNHFKEGKSFCDISEELSCDVVNKSIYSEFFKSVYLDFFEDILGFDIPVAVLGFLTYIALLSLSFIAMNKGLLRAIYLLVATSSVGFLYSLYLTGIEMFVLLTYCPLCLLSFAFIIIILILSISSMVILRRKKK